MGLHPGHGQGESPGPLELRRLTRYEADHHLPVHLLKNEGYLSIGCSSTTRPVSPLEDPRAGRWPGSAKTECGLHST